MERFKVPDDQPMESGLLSKQIENAQKKVEEQNFVARKNVLKYDDVMNTQREVIYAQRRQVLEGADLSDEIKSWVDDLVERLVELHTEGEYAEEWDLDGLVQAFNTLTDADVTVDELREDLEEMSREALVQDFLEEARELYEEKEKDWGSEIAREIERYIVLEVVDTRWREHLENMDYLREGVHLRAFAQKDPLVEYRSEGHGMFEELGLLIRADRAA
jgi:preprotein translocase subunit SecA